MSCSSSHRKLLEPSQPFFSLCSLFRKIIIPDPFLSKKESSEARFAWTQILALSPTAVCVISGCLCFPRATVTLFVKRERFQHSLHTFVQGLNGVTHLRFFAPCLATGNAHWMTISDESMLVFAFSDAAPLGGSLSKKAWHYYFRKLHKTPMKSSIVIVRTVTLECHD